MFMKLRRILYSLIFTFAFSNAYSQDWIDITNEYIKNANFDGNSYNGWEYTNNATNFQCNYECLEFWRGTFDIHQTLNVPNGKYRISVNAYYRSGNNSNSLWNYKNGREQQTALLYANNETKPLVSPYTEWLDWNYNGGCWSSEGLYYPNNMESASYCFGIGYYLNVIETEVDNGILTLGLKNETYDPDNWCIFDNFKLEYYGEIVMIESLSFKKSEIKMIEGESTILNVEILPENATFRSLTWSSSNEDVAIVDNQGKVTAIGKGVAEILVESNDESGAFASCMIEVTKNSADSKSLIINEIQSANIDMFIDPSFNYGGWVELYNPTDQTVSINKFYVSDDADNLKKFRLPYNAGTIPAKGFKNVWFDHTSVNVSQVSFKLDYDGGTIYISNEEGELIAEQTYPEAVPRTSYCRTLDGGNTWGITSVPSPESANIPGWFASERLEAPIVDKDGQLFTGKLTICVNIPEGANLIYTTDGTTPTLSNGTESKTGVFTISSTTTFRFRLFKAGMLPSEVVTRSYLYNDKNYELPIISVVTDPVNLYDDSIGVYVKGVNGRPGNGQASPHNWNMDWDRPVNFEYILPTGEMVINQEVDFAMCGGWSRSWTPHSFKLKAQKIYEGRNSLDYPFFSDKPYLKHKTLQIRNGGNDYYCRIKDAALQTIIRTSGIEIDGQAYQPTVHFINGEYIGVINMREPNNKHFVYANYGFDDEEIDQFEMSPDSGYCQMCGTEDSFLKWYDLSADAANEDTYDEICNMVDIDEYINYMAAEFYLGGTDWPQNNVKGFRPRMEGGKFRFVLYDLDGTFATTSPFSTFENKQIYTFDRLYGCEVNNITEEIKFVTIFINMLENDKFRKQFIDTYCMMGGSVFEPSRCNEIINSLTDVVDDMMSYEGASPNSTADQLKSGLSNRRQSMTSALVNYWRMRLDSSNKISANLSANIPEARIMINGLEVPTNKFNGDLFAPVTLSTKAPAGYRFVGWSSKTTTVSKTIFGKGTTWDYYDQGALDSEDWNLSTYTNTWKSGNAPLGYYTSDYNNSRGYKTELDYGSDSNNKRPTYYFRKSIYLTTLPSSSDNFALNFTADDGFIVYVNGTEAGRYLMPDGKVTYNTYSSTYANDNPDSGTLTLPGSLFKRGKNIIAVEVHNNNGTSSDIYWDAELITVANSNSTNIVSTEEEYTLPKSNHTELTAIYEPIDTEELVMAGSTPVKVNEICASNSIYINEYIKKNDWIELYNTTSEPIDVEGMYISDNISKPKKYCISASGTDANTIIAPHGYLVIWADNLVPISQLHATFKLGAEGGDVMITSSDESWSDTLSYPAHESDMSVGLYPDGGTDVYSMIKTTLGKSNIINSYSQLFEEPVFDSVDEILLARNGGLSISHTDKFINIYSDDSSVLNLSVVTTSGQICMQKELKCSDNESHRVSTENLPAGIYVAHVYDTNGNKCSIKIIIK